MAVSKAKKLLGDQLLEKGLITKEQLWDALREQSRTGDKLGEVLIKLSLVSEQVIETLTVTPKESLTNLDPELLKSVPEELVKRHRVIPLRKEGQKLIVAMSNPDNVMALDDLRLMLSLEIEPVYADASEIDAVIQKHYTIPNFEKIFNDFDSVKGQSVTGAMTLDEESIANEAPIVRLVNSLFIQAIEAKASDIHIEPHAMGVRVRFRIDGMLREIKQLRKSIQAAVISRIKIMSEIDIAEKRVPQDGRIQLEFGQRSIDLRVSTLPTIFGEKVVIRVLDRDGLAAYTLDQIGFSDMNLALFREALRSSYGMVLVTGPTGSGKTTTLYAVLNHLNDIEKNIITVEDPVEYIIKGINQTQVNVKAGMTFAAGLRSILRQDPDIIMVGEIRDTETAAIAVRAANTGHQIFSTLHTNDAPGAITRLLDMGVEPFRVSSSILGVVAQRLVRVICPHCKEAYQLDPGAPERQFLCLEPNDEITLYRGKGCEKCGNIGYRGRMAIHEVLIVDTELRNEIVKNVSTGELRQKSLAGGMISLKQDGIEKAKQGLTTIKEIMRVAYTQESNIQS